MTQVCSSLEAKNHKQRSAFHVSFAFNTFFNELHVYSLKQDKKTVTKTTAMTRIGRENLTTNFFSPINHKRKSGILSSFE